jgi:hypothetical protein
LRDFAAGKLAPAAENETADGHAKNERAIGLMAGPIFPDGILRILDLADRLRVVPVVEGIAGYARSFHTEPSQSPSSSK